MTRLLRYIMNGCYIVSLRRKVTGYITENYETQSFIIYGNYIFLYFKDYASANIVL